MLLTRRTPWPRSVPVLQREPPARTRDDVIITFIGHSTFLIQTPTETVLTDPVFATHAGPFGVLGPRRVRAPAIAFDRLGEGIIEKKGVKLACRAGCSLCCSLRVDVFAHEVFLIAHYIWTHFSAAELAYAFGEMDDAGKLRLEQFSAEHRCSPQFMPVEGRVYFTRNA